MLNHTPTKKFGQNFLIDKNVVEKFVRLANLSPDDHVVEVGPGLGTVSEEILSYGCDLYAVELDKRLFTFLKERYSGHPRFDLLNADAVQFPTAGLKDLSSYKVVASLPYAISSAWFDVILSTPHLPDSISVIIQLDAANRFLAKCDTKSFCPISIFIQSTFSKTAVYKISRNSFYPVPGVDSVILFLEKKNDPFIFSERAKEIIHAIFTTRRKQISTTLKEQGLDLQRWMTENDIPPNARPEQISIPVWQKLSIYF